MMPVILGCEGDASAPASPPISPVVNGVRTIGTTSILAIPALFAESQAPTVTPAQLRERYFDGPSSAGTLTEFFREASGQRFTLRGVVVPWVRTTVRSTDSGVGVEGDDREVDHVIEAIRAADATVQFGQFDNDVHDGKPNIGDDDGIVDGGVMIVMAEPGRHCGASSSGWWPHVATLRTRATDGVFRVADRTPSGTQIAVKAYVVVPAVACAGGLTGVAVAAHELMHLLFQAPEMYSIGALSERQPNGARLWRIGCWDVMSAGSGWGCGVGPTKDLATPTHPNPWVKETLGWVRSDTIGPVSDTTITLRPAADGGRTARFLIKPGEYFEVEYRQRTGYDRNVPASGVLIYHVDMARGTTPPTCQVWCTQPPLLVEADDNNGLLRTMDEGGNRGEAGDAFGLFGHDRFDATTAPPARADDGSPVTLRVSNIVIDEGARIARMRVSR
jgi:immune inhibitor A